MSDKFKLKSFNNTAPAKIKTNDTHFTSHGQLPARPWRIVWTSYTASASLAFESKLIALSSQNYCLQAPD